MARQTKKDSKKNNAQNSVKNVKKPRGKSKPRGLSFPKGNPYRFPKGVSGNPGGRPKLISDAYRAWLELEDKKSGLTHAQILAQQIGMRAIVGLDVQAAKEIRAATEGTRITTWKDEIIDLLKSGALSPEQAREELGDDADELVIAAGATATEIASPEEKGASEQGPANPQTESV